MLSQLPFLKRGEIIFEGEGTKMRAIIVANGHVQKGLSKLISFGPQDEIICVDGGVHNALELGLRPSVVIGDMDSLDERLLRELREEGCIFITHEREKDKVDTQLAVEYAAERGADEIIMIGALGSRLDHTLANLYLLASPVLKGVKVRMMDEVQEIYLIKDFGIIEGRAGDTVSLISLTPVTKGIYTKNLKYALTDGELTLDFPRGISNVLTGSPAEVRIGEGLLLVVKLLGLIK